MVFKTTPLSLKRRGAIELLYLHLINNSNELNFTILKIHYKKELIYFKRPFKIAHGIRTSTPIVLLQLHYKGLIGYGEASLPPYLIETQESVQAFFEKAKPFLESIIDLEDIDTIIEQVNKIQPNNTAAKASIDIALHDLAGKITEQPCWKMFNCKKEDTPYTSYTLGIDTNEGIKQKVNEGISYKYFKVKLNGENDEEIINTIRSITDKPIMVDVNQGWKNKYEALKKIEWLSTQNVLFVEQPIAKENLEDAYWLYEKSPLPIIADEAMQQLHDLENIKHCFHGINIKLMKCGGLNEAKKIITSARKNNLKVLLGCMTETSCAISAAAQLSSLVDYADLDSPLLITNDFFKGIQFVKGKIELNDLFGIGLLERL